MNINHTPLVNAAINYQKYYLSMQKFIPYKGFNKAKKDLKTKFKLFCINSKNVDMDKTIKKAEELYGKKVAKKMLEWCKKTKINQYIELGDQEYTFSDTFHSAAELLNKKYENIMQLKPYLSYRENKKAYKTIVKKALESGQTANELEKALKEKSGDFSEKTLTRVKYWSVK